MKGAELPINVLVIIVLAVIVLLGLLALYVGVWSPSSGGLALESAKNNGCHMLASTGCNEADASTITVNYDATEDGKINSDDTLLALCGKYGKSCTVLCGCTGGTGYACTADNDCCPPGPCAGVNGQCSSGTCVCGGGGALCPPAGP